jgi:protein phosphatase 1 regulatory subunit 7
MNSHDDCDDVELPDPAPPVKTSGEKEEILHVLTTDETIEINNVRLFSFDEVELEKFVNCTSLSMRKNLLHVLTDFPAPLAAQLVELDLFDNKVKRIGSFFSNPVSPFLAIVKVDLSYNQLKEIEEGFSALAPTLRELYLVENRLKEVKNLGALVNLRLLELGGNRLRDVGDGLSTLVNLEELWLGKNKIERLGTSFNQLKKLKRLSLQANRLTSLEECNFPAGANPELNELYLSENGLTEIQHVGQLPGLTLLDFSFNPISIINGDVISVTNMPVLEEFWLTDGKIDQWAEVDKLAQFSATLRTVYLERNPIESDKRYRDKVFMALSFITQIDSWPVVNKSNPEADRAIHRR